MLDQSTIMSLPSVTEILGAEGVAYTGNYTAETAQRGTDVHDLWYKYTHGTFRYEHVTKELEGYVEGFINFISENRLKILMAEITVAHKWLGFRGRPDDVCLLDYEPTILDLKTGSVAASTAQQLSGYEMLAAQEFPEHSHWARYAVCLPGDGTYKLVPFTDPSDKARWLQTLTDYQKARQ